MKCRVSKHFSPRIIVHKKNLDFNEYLEFMLEACAQALNELNKTNANALGVLNYLFLRPNAAKQGKYELMHLPTSKIIIKRKT